MWTPKFLANESIAVHIADGTNENGALKIVQVVDLKARIEAANEIVYLPDGKKGTLKQKAFVFEDLDKLPERFEGKIVVGNVEYILVSVRLCLNPDGSRNHFVLGMM